MKIFRKYMSLSLFFLVPLACVQLVWADPAKDAFSEGMRLLAEGQHKNAIPEFDKALRLNPRYAEAYTARGITYNEMAQYERAIKDYDAALALDPKSTEAYFNRANSYNDLGQPERALKDYDEALRLDQNYFGAYYNRALVHMTLRQTDAAADARAYIKLKGWKEENGRDQYMVLFAYFGDRWAKRDKEARAILDEAASNCDTTKWPYPIIRYLHRELTVEDLLAAATDLDKRTEARTYLGMDLALAGNRVDSHTHLTWVKENGNKAFAEYGFALSELRRAEESAAAKQ
jgi:tetratricopeptide (TPR) repeat protein